MENIATGKFAAAVSNAGGLGLIGAGGIADGRQLLSVLAMGAAGVQLGTCLLVSEECQIHEKYKNAVINAKDNDTTVTGRIGGTNFYLDRQQLADYLGVERTALSKELGKMRDDGMLTFKKMSFTL